MNNMTNRRVGVKFKPIPTIGIEYYDENKNICIWEVEFTDPDLLKDTDSMLAYLSLNHGKYFNQKNISQKQLEQILSYLNSNCNNDSHNCSIKNDSVLTDNISSDNMYGNNINLSNDTNIDVNRNQNKKGVTNSVNNNDIRTNNHNIADNNRNTVNTNKNTDNNNKNTDNTNKNTKNIDNIYNNEIDIDFPSDLPNNNTNDDNYFYDNNLNTSGNIPNINDTEHFFGADFSPDFSGSLGAFSNEMNNVQIFQEDNSIIPVKKDLKQSEKQNITENRTQNDQNTFSAIKQINNQVETVNMQVFDINRKSNQVNQQDPTVFPRNTNFTQIKDTTNRENEVSQHNLISLDDLSDPNEVSEIDFDSNEEDGFQ